MNLSFLIGLKPELAIKYLAANNIRIPADWEHIYQQAKGESAKLGEIVRLEVLQRTRDKITSAIAEGWSFERFRKELEPAFKAIGFWGKADGKTVASPWRLELIYRVHLQSAMQAGRYQAQMQAIGSRPYGQYVAILDKSTRDSHRLLHGKVFPLDHPFWSSFYPPNGCRCRCRVRTLSLRDIQRNNIAIENPDLQFDTRQIGKKSEQFAIYTDPDTGQKVSPDFGWSRNVGQEVN